ncbi:hypothetical protein [Pedobacter sp. MC2016-24]|uniref:hypothetical protein n=1 Tax=Pedobacter sp. MC2016-24 TaxID=2780090 RepID=UPI00187FB3D1|nr:hypothetical protein [Pedobacter sp. MC2016-24]MBE9601517.1 hypothetical protein [Pedobacter sp. MC2016-24]
MMMSMYVKFSCHMGMKMDYPDIKEVEEELPFNFKRKEISVAKIEAHWQNIRDRLMIANAKDFQVKTERNKN